MSIVMKLVALVLGVSMTVACPVRAAEVNMESLLKETQRLSQESDAFTLVWWAPEAYWSAAFAQTPGVTSVQLEEALGAVRPYTIMIVADGKRSVFGGVKYRSEDSIRAIVRLVDSQGKQYKPLKPWEVEADTRSLLQMMRPMFASMIGPMGENMNFILFPAKSDSGLAIADPKGSGQLTVLLGDKEFRWRLPLDALLPTWDCTACKVECQGSWTFCPWCGKSRATKEE